MATTLSLVPTEIDIDLDQGSDKPIEFQISKGGQAVNITNDTIYFTARDFYFGNVTIPTKANGPGQHSDPENGKTMFVLERDEVISEGNEAYTATWYYEVRRLDASTGLEMVHIQGRLNLKPMVGRT